MTRDMSEKKRRWFQIHLSTAVVLMFVAGAILWANVASHEFVYLNNKSKAWEAIAVHGWPIYADRPAEHPVYSILWAANVIVGFFVLTMTWVFCESLIRRREARKT